MPRRTVRRVIRHAADSRTCRWSVRRRLDVTRHSICRTVLTLATAISLVVGVSEGDHSPSSSASEDSISSRFVEAFERSSIESRTHIKRNQMMIPGVSYDANNEFVKQSVSLSLFVFVFL